VPDAQTVNAKYFDDDARALQVAGDQLVYVNPETAGIFADRLPPLTLGGVYRITGETQSFSLDHDDYDDWREWLCRSLLCVRCEILYALPARFSGNPLTRLINFTDSDGWIGHADCMVLATAFKKRAEEARRHSVVARRPGPNRFALYQQFAATFALAAERGGAVQFHETKSL
jgi:hypothetical protein